MSIRILLADDHAVLRSGLRLLLESQEDLCVVGEATTGQETLRLVEQLQPDLILLDLSMPQLGGLEALPLLKKLASEAKILILTMHDDAHYLQRALKSGATGYVLKKAADVELISAIRAVMRGEIYIHPSMTRLLLDDMLPKAKSQPVDAWDTLSEREQEVLRLVALGHTNAEIAEQLHLSIKTVETYRSRGTEKLGLTSRAALVRYALEKGIIGDL